MSPRLRGGPAGRDAASPCTLIAVTSGKGGVGKTSVVVNLAVALAHRGLAVTVLDADLGLANLDVYLGLAPERTIEQFFNGHATLADLAIAGPAGIRVIPAASGIPELTRLSGADWTRFVEGLDALRPGCDVLLIDTAAGISEHVSRFVVLADRALLVTWPEPTALVDAYAALKVLLRRRQAQPVGLVVNGVADEHEAKQVHARLLATAERFLGSHVDLDGFIPRDETVEVAARAQRAVVEAQPHAPASRGFARLAQRMVTLAGDLRHQGSDGRWSRSAASTGTQH